MPPSNGTDFDQTFRQFVRTRESELLARLFESASERLLAFARSLVDDEMLAEDLLQETFLTLIEAADNYDGSRPAMPYVRGILHRKAQQARARPARYETSGTDPDEIEVGTGVEAERPDCTEFLARVSAAISGLPRPYREVLQLNLEGGYTPAEIGHRLGRAAGTIWVQLHRGLELLRRSWRGPVPVLATLATLGAVRAAIRQARPRPAVRPPVRRLIVAASAVAVGCTIAISLAQGPSVSGSAGGGSEVAAAKAGVASAAARPSSGGRARVELVATGHPIARSIELVWRGSRAPAAGVGAWVVRGLGSVSDLGGERVASDAENPSGTFDPFYDLDGHFDVFDGKATLSGARGRTQLGENYRLQVTDVYQITPGGTVDLRAVGFGRTYTGLMGYGVSVQTFRGSSAQPPNASRSPARGACRPPSCRRSHPARSTLPWAARRGRRLTRRGRARLAPRPGCRAADPARGRRAASGSRPSPRRRGCDRRCRRRVAGERRGLRGSS